MVNSTELDKPYIIDVCCPCPSASVLLHPCRIFAVRGLVVARQVRNAKLDSRTARARLPRRREPFWTVISAGCALGYRQGAKSGTWIGKFRDEQGRRHYEAFGAADDNRDADGISVFYQNGGRRKGFRKKNEMGER